MKKNPFNPIITHRPAVRQPLMIKPLRTDFCEGQILWGSGVNKHQNLKNVTRDPRKIEPQKNSFYEWKLIPLFLLRKTVNVASAILSTLALSGEVYTLLKCRVAWGRMAVGTCPLLKPNQRQAVSLLFLYSRTASFHNCWMHFLAILTRCDSSLTPARYR